MRAKIGPEKLSKDAKDSSPYGSVLVGRRRAHHSGQIVDQHAVREEEGVGDDASRPG